MTLPNYFRANLQSYFDLITVKFVTWKFTELGSGVALAVCARV